MCLHSLMKSRYTGVSYLLLNTVFATAGYSGWIRKKIKMTPDEVISESNLVTDQYEDGKAAAYWEQVVTNTRQEYKDFLVGQLRARGCETVLDAACGNGVTSMMLVEAGFRVVSTDASPAMLLLAEAARRRRLSNPKYQQWTISKANWLSLPENIQTILPNTSFDAVICLGNSFTHLLDDRDNHSLQSQALANFSRCLKETGILVIDHRNYDAILRDGTMTADSIYYQRDGRCPLNLEISILDVGRAKVVATDFFFTSTSGDHQGFALRDFRLCHYAYKLDVFQRLLRAAFRSTLHTVYADFKEPANNPEPLFYIHVIQKDANGINKTNS